MELDTLTTEEYAETFPERSYECGFVINQNLDDGLSYIRTAVPSKKYVTSIFTSLVHKSDWPYHLRVHRAFVLLPAAMDWKYDIGYYWMSILQEHSTGTCNKGNNKLHGPDLRHVDISR